jgi:hypothetical protein
VNNPFYKSDGQLPPLPRPQPAPINPQPASVTSNHLPESIRLERLALCEQCKHNVSGLCVKCKICGAKKIEVGVTILTLGCPMKKWLPWITFNQKTS